MNRGWARQSIEPEEAPPGLIEYEARTAVRNLIRTLGFEQARDQLASILMDEADNKRARQ